MTRRGKAGPDSACLGTARHGKAWQVDDLIKFEDEVADLFNAGQIPFPIHLSNGNEQALIDIFQDVTEQDWICGSWRSHYHCLLKGIPPEELKAAILRGESIALSFPKHRILNSAIVGGSIPIALGIAMGIKRAGGDERVHVFMGDMSAETGAAHEAMKYARFNKLPMRWIVENNQLSVCTLTADAWGGWLDWTGYDDVEYYLNYSKYPHAGAGRRIQF